MRQIILASGSPRRIEMLTQMGVVFTVVPSDFDEQLDERQTSEAVANMLALSKARAVAERYPAALVIGGDTVVAHGTRQFGKAEDEGSARAMLRSIAGQEVQVVSSIALVCKELNLAVVQADQACLLFKPYDQTTLDTYMRFGHWQDKAAAIGIQSGAASLIEYMKGEYDTVLGMPTHLLATMLKKVGVQATPVELALPVPKK